MPLVPCRACQHPVDTSALACPKCGATDPAKKISRQQRELRTTIVQLLVGLTLLGAAGWYAWHEFLPTLKAAVLKQKEG